MPKIKNFFIFLSLIVAFNISSQTPESEICDHSGAAFFETEEELFDFVEAYLKKISTLTEKPNPGVVWNNSCTIVENASFFNKKLHIGKKAYTKFTKNEIKALVRASVFSVSKIHNYKPICILAPILIQIFITNTVSYVPKIPLSLTLRLYNAAETHFTTKSRIKADKQALKNSDINAKDLTSGLKKIEAEIRLKQTILSLFKPNLELITLQAILFLQNKYEWDNLAADKIYYEKHIRQETDRSKQNTAMLSLYNDQQEHYKRHSHFLDDKGVFATYLHNIEEQMSSRIKTLTEQLQDTERKQEQSRKPDLKKALRQMALNYIVATKLNILSRFILQKKFNKELITVLNPTQARINALEKIIEEDSFEIGQN